MHNDTVIFLGAGFSVDAKIPVQSQIWDLMLRKTTDGVNKSLFDDGSRKFLRAYIDVGLFLLKEFTKRDTSKVEQYLDRVNYIDQLDCILLNSNGEVQSLFDGLIEMLPLEEDSTRDFLHYLKDGFAHKKLFDLLEAQKDKDLIELKEVIRTTLLDEKLNIDLEDIFTLFDKCFREYENWHEITYNELDKLRHSILRLFTYYFGEKINSFRSKNIKAYDRFAAFCKTNNVNILTTNWDTVLEIVLQQNKIQYNTYFDKKSDTFLNVEKLHGSINWIKCNCCGEYEVIKDKQIATYLLSDDKPEVCSHCGIKANENQIILQPEIITPTMLKTLNSRLFREIWNDAAHMLEKASRIIFIGYSLPLADYEIRYLLRKNIKHSAKIEVVLAQTDQPKNKLEIWSKPESRYRSLFPVNEITFNYKGLRHYF